MASRRDFLNAISAGGLALTQTPLSWADLQLPDAGIRMDSETMRIVKLIDDTPREDCQAALVKELRRGTPYRELLAAAFLFAALRDGHHSVYLVHSAHQLSLDLSADDRMLPLFWAVDVMKEHLTRFGNSEVKPIKGPLPSARNADAEFTAAMEAMDREKAEHAIIAVSRAMGPKQAYACLLSYAARDNFFHWAHSHRHGQRWPNSKYDWLATCRTDAPLHCSRRVSRRAHAGWATLCP